jgi:UDP-N-acetyl-D-mannosaminuronic acid dehydrogenase
MKMAIVGGGGHVGLPFGLVFASAGVDVTAFDNSQSRVDEILSGNMPFIEKGAKELLFEGLKSKKFKITTNPNSITEAEIVTIVIGTPVDEFLAPNPNSLLDLMKSLLPFLNASQLIILRSTIFTGVTSKVQDFLESRIPGIAVVYCPERIIEGNAIEELKSLPQIIGTDSDVSYLKAEKLWEKIGVKCLKSSPQEAELAKLFTNVWRYIKFAIANQFFMISNDMDLNYENIRQIIKWNYPRASDLPSSGFTAGPCLFKDTMQMSALLGNNFILGHSAMLINEGLPNYIVEKLKKRFDLRNLTVGILGMAFKADVDDIRGSLAFKLRKLLIFECKEVLVTDVHIENKNFTQIDDVVSNCDLIIIGAPHKEYQNLNFEKPVIDIWNLYGDGVVI